MDPKIHLGKLSTFFPQKRNPNRHTERGLSLLESAMSSVGYVAPMTATADGEVIDGSARLEKSALVFPDKDPLIVDHDGSRPVIMRRTDIPNANDPRAKEVSYGANRIAEVNLSLNPVMLQEDFFTFDLKPLWTESEIEKVAEQFPPPDLDVNGEGRGGSIGDGDFSYEPSHVRMVQLFLNTETFPLFNSYIDRLKADYGTANPTDTVMEALRRASPTS